VWVAGWELGVLREGHVQGWWQRAGGTFVTINVESLLNRQGLVVVFVLMPFDMVEFKAVGVELLDLMVDFCKDWVIISNGFLGVWCVQVTIDSSDDPAVVTVHMNGVGSQDGEWVESRVLTEEA